MFDELRAQPGTYLGKFYGCCMVTQLGHRKPGVTARVDPSERRQVHVHIQGQAMKGTTVANAQPQGGDFRAIHTYTPGASGLATAVTP